MHQKHKILELRAKGYTYNQIKDELKCSKGTISYHCNDTTKVKTLKRRSSHRIKQHPYQAKLAHFKESKSRKQIYVSCLSDDKRILQKVITFMNRGKNRPMTNFTIQDIINKFGENPRCYLTGELINIYNPNEYQFDHIQAISRGGTNELDNLGIATKKANRAKCDMTVAELLEFCEKVLTNHNYKVEKLTNKSSSDEI